MLDEAAYHELCAYTLSHKDPVFLHQYVVDAWLIQNNPASAKPIGIAFALLGLYLAVEHKVSGRVVQRAHMVLANQRRNWPAFTIVPPQVDLSPEWVLAASSGRQRDKRIREWIATVRHALPETTRMQAAVFVQMEAPGFIPSA